MAATVRRSHWIDDDGSGTTGTVINDAEKQKLYDDIDVGLAAVYNASVPGASGDLYEKGRTTPAGHWIDVAFNAASFQPDGTGGNTWTVTAANQSILCYALIGKTAHLKLQLVNTVVSGTNAYLKWTLPFAIDVNRCPLTVFASFGAGPNSVGYVNVASATQLLLYYNLAAAAWPATSSLAIAVQLTAVLP
jgi:hypothetical protein